MTKYFEDYQVGENFISPGRTMTEGEIAILEGIGRFSEPLMIDKNFAKTTIFGAPIVPAPVVMFIVGGLEALAEVLDDETTIRLSTENNIKFRNPLRAGDNIHLEGEIIDKKEASQPDAGLIAHRHICKNDKGETVVEYDDSHLVKRRPV